MRKTYTANFKAKVVLEVLREAKSLAQIASENDVHSTQLNTWKREVIEGLPELLADARRKDSEKEELRQQVQELYTQLGEVTSQLNWLKKKSGIDISAR